LPNITGTFVFYCATGGGDGAFYNANLGDHNGAPNGSGSHTVGFNASRSSSVYGSSNTVTPLSRACIFCIKF